MDFLRVQARIVGTPWQERAARNAPGFAAPRPDRLRTSRPSSATTGPRAYRAAYLVVHDAAAAEDIAQEAFLSAVRALDAFDRGRPFGPWLHRIVVNRAIDRRGHGRCAREVGDEQLAVAAAADGGDPRRPRRRDMAALGSLAPDHRAVVVLRYVLDYSPGEIAELLELPRGTVNSRLRRGLDTLQERVMREQS